MSAQPAGSASCRVENADKLPPASGGEAALCAAISEAVAARGVAASYSVVVRVVSDSQLEASITSANGTTLPEQKYASSDRPLSASAFNRFAQVVADRLAKAS